MMTLGQLLERFPTDDECMTYLVKLRWPEGVRCPKCDSPKVYRLNRGKGFRWVCKHAKNGYRFSPLVGTIFENTNIPLRTWFQAILLMCVSKKGISALQIQRTLGLGSYKSAWYMCHRVRAAMHDQGFPNLMGVVEVDETYVGGENRNRHISERGKLEGRGPVNHVPVIGAIARKGSVVCKVIENTSAATLKGFVDEVVSEKVDLVAHDDAAGYRHLEQPHAGVRHSRGEYVRGNIHTANIDSFWSLLKRGIMGSFHQVSKDYLPLYLAEFMFRHNHRKDPDMFTTVLRAC